MSKVNLEDKLLQKYKELKAQNTQSSDKEDDDNKEPNSKDSKEKSHLIDSQQIEEIKQRLDPSCWKGYRKVGTKIKGGVRVNDCEKINEDYGGYDHTMEIENPNFEVEGHPSADLEVIEVGVNFKVYGRYIPARINYDDYDHPAEYPEIDDVQIFDLSHETPLDITDAVYESPYKTYEEVESEIMDIVMNASLSRRRRGHYDEDTVQEQGSAIGGGAVGGTSQLTVSPGTNKPATGTDKDLNIDDAAALSRIVKNAGLKSEFDRLANKAGGTGTATGEVGQREIEDFKKIQSDKALLSQWQQLVKKAGV